MELVQERFTIFQPARPYDGVRTPPFSEHCPYMLFGGPFFGQHPGKEIEGMVPFCNGKRADKPKVLYPGFCGLIDKSDHSIPIYFSR